MGYDGEERDCPSCGWVNFTIRRHCRRCGRRLPGAERVGTTAAPAERRDDGRPPTALRDAAETYCVGLLVSEAGEALQEAGNALRFGLDTPHSADLPETAREHLVHELGDVLAAVEFCCLHGLFDRAGIEAARDRKLATLCDAANRDHLGRPLAPQPIRLGEEGPDPLVVGMLCAIRLLPEGVVEFDGKTSPTSTPITIRVPGHESAALIAALLPNQSGCATSEGLHRLITARLESGRASLTFERDGKPFDLVLDFDGARDLQRLLAACFLDFRG